MRLSLCCTIVLAAAIALAAANAVAQPLRGFVSGELLLRWCDGATREDRLDCITYLRGVSDTLNALGWGAEANETPAADRARWPNQCMPARVSIGTVRDRFLGYAERNPDLLGNQAALLLITVFREAWPCS